MRSHLSIGGLSFWVITSLECPYLCLYLIGYSLHIPLGVSDFTLRSLIHLRYIFIQDDRQRSSFNLLYVAFQFSQHHAVPASTVFSSGSIFFFFQKSALRLQGFIPGSSVVFRWPVSVLVPVPHCFNFSGSTAELEVRHDNFFSIVLLVRVCFGSPGLLCFHVNFKIFFFCFCEEYQGDLGSDYNESLNSFARMIIVMVLILPIYENERFSTFHCLTQEFLGFVLFWVQRFFSSSWFLQWWDIVW